MTTPRDRIEARLGLTGPPLQSVRGSPPAIPDHDLVRQIGQGAYGEVWLARNALGTCRAVKIVYRDNFKDERPYEREFAGIRRFEPLSRSNEGFVDILQVGRDDAGGWFYYVMELADDVTPVFQPASPARVEAGDTSSHPDSPAGKSALQPETYSPRTLSRDLHQRGRLPLADCLELGLNLTLALGHLHRHGLIHRDIKPSNIIFVGGVPKLADIGLVTEAEGANTFVGTEGFVPPEGPTSPQADLYALGKVLYEAAMGKDRQEFPEPFTQIGTDAESLALMELNAVLLRACAPDSKKRYATAEQMHADLSLLHSGGSVRRRHQFDRQFQIAKQVGAVAITATLLIGAAWYWQRGQTQKMTQLAGEKAALANEKTAVAESLSRLGEENRNRIVRLDVANGVRLLDEGDPAAALLWFADALQFLTNNPTEEAIHRIRIQQTLAQTPRILRALPHDSEVSSGTFSPDGHLVATGTKDGNLRVWNVADGLLLWGPKRVGAAIYYLRFSRDGKKLFASSSREQGMFNGGLPGFTVLAVLDAASGREMLPANAAWSGLPTNVVCAHFSPDDRWLALSEKGGVIRIFNLEDAKQLLELRSHTDEVASLSFTADGALLASASRDRTVRLWRLPSGEPAGAPFEHRWPVARVLLSEDGRHMITASFARPGSADLGQQSESEVQAWEVPAGRHLGQTIPTGGWINMFVAPGRQERFFAPDGMGLQAYSLASSTQTPVRLQMGGEHCWGFSKDGSRLALGNGEYLARVFDSRTGAPLTGPLRHGHWSVNAVQFSPDEKILLTASSDGNARLWDLRQLSTESLRRTLAAPMQKLSPESFRSDSGLGRASERTPIFLTDGSLRLFGEDLEELNRFRNPYPGMKFRGIASAWQSGLWALERYDPDTKAVLLWHPHSHESQGFLIEHPDEVHGHIFTSDDRFLVTTCRDGAVRFWRTSDGGLERMVRAPEGISGGIGELSPDGRTALWIRALNPGQEVQFLDLDSGKIIGEPHALLAGIFETAFSPDGEHVALLDVNGPVKVLESRTGRLISSRIAHTSNLIYVEWNLDGRRLLTAGHDDQVLVWNAETGTQLLGPLRTPGGTIRMARWSPDGRFIIARNEAKQVRVWDSATGEAITPALKHEGEVAFAVMTRGNCLISASYPDLLRAWDLKPCPLPAGILADYAKFLSGRYLSANGAFQTLTPHELARLNGSLLQRAPELFQ